MSRTLTRSPLTAIAMNGAGAQRKRRSARLSGESDGEPGDGRGVDEEGERRDGQAAKKMKMTTATTSKIGTKEGDGDSNKLSAKGRGYDETVDGFSFRRGRGRRAKEPEQGVQRAEPEPVVAAAPVEIKAPPPAKVAAPEAKPKGRKGNKVYSEQVDDFAFNRGRGRRGKEASQPPLQAPPTREALTTAEAVPAPSAARDVTPPPQNTEKKARRRIPDTPELAKTDKRTRSSKRPSNQDVIEPQPSPQRPGHAKSHQNTARSPSPQHKPQPVTVEKKRKKNAEGVEEEEKTMRILLPFQDTPVIRRNKEMRKESGEGHRRSSTGLRGRRASSLIDEGRGNALPHAEVSSADFFKHISADLTEPRRMRCLLGWCGARAMPAKPAAPKDNSPASSLEFQASQAALVILEELSNDLFSKDSLSNWFGRDEQAPAPPVPLRRKANPRNVDNAAKAIELEQELERLNEERSEWDTLIKSAALKATTPAPPSPTKTNADLDGPAALSPIHTNLLDSPQRAILDQLTAPPTTTSTATPATTDPTALQQRLQSLSANLEFSIDQFAHGVHTLTTAQSTADRVAARAVADAAAVLEQRDRARPDKGADALDSLRALGKVLNGKLR